jgi:hypothetical protein
MSSLALIRDMQHERRIRRLSRACAGAQAAGDHDAAMIHWEQLREANAERSPEQVARMESRMGLHTRRQVKSVLMHAFTHGCIPAGLVAITFRLLDLRGV